MAAASPTNATFEDAFRGAASGGLDLVLFLDFQTIAALSQTSKTLHQRTDRWCKPAVAEAALRQHAKLQAIHDSGMPGAAELTFDLYCTFLRGLQELPLDDDALGMPSYRQRFAVASAPRPRLSCLQGLRFDWGYHGRTPEKGWCDVFDNGAPNDFVRRVGDHPNTWLALTVAGADLKPTQDTYGLKHLAPGTAVAVEGEELIGIQAHHRSGPGAAAFQATHDLWRAVEARLGGEAPGAAAAQPVPEVPVPPGPGPPPLLPPHVWLGTPPRG